MAYVPIRATVHIGRLAANASPFTAAIPAQHPGTLQYCSIDEGFQTGRPQLPPQEAVAEIVLLDQREEYEKRRIQAGDFVVIQDTEGDGAPVVRFRGRAYKPDVEDARRGRIEIRLKAHGLWERLIGLPEVSVDAIQDANGKQAVDSVLDVAEWPTSFRDVPTPQGGADAEFPEWAFDGKPHVGIARALAGINPRSKYWVGADGTLRVRWLSQDIRQLGQRDIRPDLRFKESDLHVINQVVVPSVDVSRVTTTHWTSTATVNLTDDADTVIYQQVVTIAAEAQWSYRLRQANGTYFQAHPDVLANLTASPIAGTEYSYNLTLTARSKSGNYTTVANFFQLQYTVVMLTAGTDPPAVYNQGDVAPAEPRTLELPALGYTGEAAETLALNYLSLWGEPFEFAAFSVPMGDDATVAKVRGLDLWQRMSIFDGNETHFGFCVRRKIEYVHPRPMAIIEMMEDFTEGGDISVPFRQPFEWVFNSLAALDMFFDRASALTSRGGWQQDTNGGSTPSSRTGPTANNALAYVHTETSGGDERSHEANGVIVANDDGFDALNTRDVIFRYAAYGDFRAGDGLEVQGRTVQRGTVTDALIATRNDARRINLANVRDTSPPFGVVGNWPAGLFPVGLDELPDGDWVAVDILGRLWRINPLNTRDTTGDYGLIGSVPLTTNFFAGGIAVDANGDALIVEEHRTLSVHSTRIRRASVATPSLTSGIYGLLGTVYADTTVFPAATDGKSIAVRSDGDILIGNRRNGAILRVDPANPSNMADPYGSLGDVPGIGGALDGLDLIDGTRGLVFARSGNNVSLALFNPGDISDTSGEYGGLGTVNVGSSAFAVMALEREIVNYGEWTRIATLPASGYRPGNLSQGDGVVDVNGQAYTVAADGGWQDYRVSIPGTYQELRLVPNLNGAGVGSSQDIALRSVRSA